MRLPPLLITAAFDIGRTPHVALRDTRQRVVHHLEGLLAWLEMSEFSTIVFAKNCGTKIQPRVLEDLAASFGKELECLEIPPARKTEIQGKGFGEGEIVNAALQRSRFLGRADGFVKSTGKLFSGNHRLLLHDFQQMVCFRCAAPQISKPMPWHCLVNKFHKSEAGSKWLAALHQFLKVPWILIGARPHSWVDTRFYFCRRDFYLGKLSRSHQRVQDRLGYSLEAAFFDDLKGVDGIRWIDEMPVVYGTSGTLGTSAASFPDHITQRAKSLAPDLLFK